jgi:two-component system, OmpR family, sensor histidine kinase KdpD
VTALVAALAYNLAFIPPFGTLTADVVEDVIALAVFTVVGLAVGTLVAWESDRRRAAEQRAGELADLYERYRAAAAEANRLAVLEQVDQQRAALLRSVSHDLRTPLSTIRAVTSDLRAGAAYDDATRDDLLDLVIGEAERLDRIVANLLSLSRVEAGALRPDRQAVALDELVTDRVAHLGRLLDDVDVVVNVSDELPLVDADYSQVDQVITNLLENAVRHAPQNTKIEVTGWVQSDGRVAIAVDDAGPGVPAAERDRIFEPFHRGEGSTSSGVGLAICRAFVEAHGGTIAVRTSPAGGARFVFTLPARRD